MKKQIFDDLNDDHYLQNQGKTLSQPNMPPRNNQNEYVKQNELDIINLSNVSNDRQSLDLVDDLEKNSLQEVSKVDDNRN